MLRTSHNTIAYPALMAVVLLSSFLSLQAVTPKTIDSLIKITKSRAGYEKKIETLIALSSVLMEVDDRKSLSYSAQAYDIAREKGKEKYYARALNQMALAEFGLGKQKEAYTHGMQALKYAAAFKDTATLQSAYGAMGLVFKNWGAYEEALKMYGESIKITKKTPGSKGPLGQMYVNIGSIYVNMEKPETALFYYKEGLKIALEKNFLPGISFCYANIGNAYLQMKDFGKALEYYKKAAEIFRKINYTAVYVQALCSIADAYCETGRFQEAKAALDEALMLAMQSGNTRRMNLVYPHIGNWHKEQGRLRQALQYYELGIESESGGAISAETETNLLKTLAELHGEAGNHKTANYYMTQYVDRKTKAATEKNKNYTAYIEARLKYDISKEKIKTLQTENKNKNYLIVSIVCILVLLTGAIYMAISSLKRKTRNSRELKEKNDELEVKNLMLAELNATKDKFFSIIAHDIKNPSGLMVKNSELLMDERVRGDDELLEATIQDVNKSAAAIDKLLENLLLWSRMQMGKISIYEEETNLRGLVELSAEALLPVARDKNIKVDISGDSDARATMDMNMMATVIRNLLGNAIKFTNPGGSINISFSSNGAGTVFVIADTGIGIDGQDLEKLFRLDIHYTKIGTSSEKGTGLGLILCKELVEMHSGSISVVSEKGAGTEFRVSIPPR